jgi:DHA1 family multidrug resistance protein-like MFS transporter
LSEAARRRGLATILVDTFLVYGGFFMVIPLISVHYVDGLGWAAASIGLVLALRQLLQQGSTPVAGILADRFGVKWLICAGVLLRAVGFLSLAWATTFPLLLLSALLAALGGSLFEAPKSAAIAALTDEQNRARFYSLTGVVGGLGVAIGTQVGALLLAANFALVALVAASCFFVDFAITLIFLPPVRVASASDGGTLVRGIGLALRDRPFMTFNVLLMGYWFLWVQFTISLPLAAKAISGTASAVGWIYAINSVMLIVLSYPLIRLAGRWLRPLPILTLGLLLMALGIGAVALAGNMPVLLGCVVCLCLGVVLAAPSQQTVAASLANPAALGSYFGVNSLALAFGGGLGNFSGGLLYDLGGRWHLPALPWLVFGLVGLATTMGLWRMARGQQRRHMAGETPAQHEKASGITPAGARGR